MSSLELMLPEVPGQHRLGRHIRHDPRSLNFRVLPRGVAVEPRTVAHARRIPILDQGKPISIGSCTCSSATGVLGSDPFYATLPVDLQRTLSDAAAAQAWATDLYREVTKEDPFPGSYEPDDTGSDGLTVAKVLKRRGLIAGYQHITGLDSAHAAIQKAPFFVGTSWRAGLGQPDASGLVANSGTLRGGHQYQCFGYDLERDRWRFWQTCGPRFGLRGEFSMTSATFAGLLADRGDATLFVPLDQPAPAPSPPPILSAFPINAVRPWLVGTHRTNREKVAAAAITNYLTAP
jgi:hypothetical protein